jgi:hypothetical protein
MMKGYDIYDCFTMEHFQLRQRMTLTIKIYCSRLYQIIKPDFGDLYFATNYCLKMTDFRQINRKFLLEFIELFAVFRVYGKYMLL